MTARWLDLYENDTIVNEEDTTLRTEYYKLLQNDPQLLGLASAAKADVAKAKTGETDFDAIAPLDVWENKVQRVRLLDKKYRTDYKSLSGEDTTAGKERQSDLGRIADQLEALNNAGNAPKPGDDTKGSDNSNQNPGKTPGGVSGATIAAIVIGVLAALGGIVAVAFPHIQQFLPKF